jgi:ribosome-associated toxin RatA of RatAB toxin-antitoxin module
MPKFTTTKHVSVSPDVAYSVAADVSSYKDFLPMLLRSIVRGERKVHGAGEQFMAELVVGYEKLGIRESFVSTVTTDPVARTVLASSSEGPMQALTTSWKIAEAAGGADVSITIDYAFRSRLMQIAFSGLLDMAAPKIMAAFEAQAKNISS